MMLARLDNSVKERYIYGRVMGKRGPKPVNVEHLKGDASSWASFFYTLRDGQSGHMQRFAWGPMEEQGGLRYRRGKPLGPVIVIPVSKAARTLPREMRSKDWAIFRPVMPAPELWEQLKQARSAREIRAVSRKIRKWVDKEFGQAGRWLPGSPPVDYCDALHMYAESIIVGKRLPSYAKTDRPSSDDKRVQLVAKVLAGARYGIAPVTAAKRLSHWHFQRDWAEKTLRDYEERSRKQFGDKEYRNVK